LQRACRLPVLSDVPLIGHISRLVEQKGIDLLLATLPELLKRKMQMVVLGNGDPEFEKGLQNVAKRHKDRMSVHIGYSEELAHRIEAGSDMFLMPSRFEPCGLNQLYSLRYGTVPVVRRTGGLADTVVDATGAALELGSATGFVFDKPAPDALHSSVHRALALYDEPRRWRKLVQAGMRQDFSWKTSAGHYQDLYHQAVV
jgi:starch synthase